MSIKPLLAHEYKEYQVFNAHIHGVGELFVAIENDQLYLNISAPSESFLGFEHQASTQLEHSILDKTKAFLQQAKNIVTLEGGNCSVVVHELESTLFDQNIKDNHTHDPNHQATESSHSEITINSHYLCQNAAQLRSIKLALFSRFTELERLKAVVIDDHGQHSRIIDRDNPILIIK
ncbi:DUF2796 domain-containing protein [Endozoicomonas sp. G2_1]|uniref:ZrgA family zinc uptake protein n=1 Tax=Endozoicomonas sp. G2_1 TaxID=2821091 RepID=UPI001AD9FAE0|nr:DUF2796 domain-containing protein [Endozoicomonas sp. G2_1]MBO9490580.1 DUF2796 domain-containing protein [Endozoicomonas sp. G2_1]